MNQFSKNLRHGKDKKIKKTNGYLIVAIIAMTVVLGTIGLSVAKTVSVKYAKTKRDIASSTAIYIAEAAVSDTVTRLNADSSFTGYSTKKTYYSDTSKGKADYTSVVSGSGAERKVVATGNVYGTPESTTPIVSRKVQVILAEKASTGAPGAVATTPYSIYAGTAGINVAGSSKLIGKVSSFGDMYVKGKLSVTGDSDAPLYPFPFYSSATGRTFVNNTACISGTAYPIQCGTSSPPITVSADSAVNGSVCAPEQTTATNISQPGLQSGCTAPVIEDATFDKAAYTATMTAPSKASSLSTSRCTSTVDKITWTDKTTYTGALDTSTRDCEISLQGDVYIKGNLSLGSGTKIVQPYALRNTPLSIIVDGTVTLSGAKFRYESNASGGVQQNGAVIRIISFASSNSTCSTSNSCNTRLTSTARKTYETTTNVRCINACGAASTLLWSYNGTVLVDSNSEAGMINGQGVTVQGGSSAGSLWLPNSTPRPPFGSGSTLPYTSYTTDILGTPSGWRIVDYRQIYS